MSTDATIRTDLRIDGMTCAACSSRIQRRLEKLETVADVQVNFANGRARIDHDTSLGVDSLVAEVESLGYAVIDDGSGNEAELAREANLRRRLVVAAVLTVPTVMIAMLPSLRFEAWEWAVGALAYLHSRSPPLDQRDLHGGVRTMRGEGDQATGQSAADDSEIDAKSTHRPIR